MPTVSNHGADARACSGSLRTCADRAMLTLPRWQEALGGDCWPSEGAHDELTCPSPTLELRNERAPMRMPQRLRYSLLPFTQRDRDVALLLADEETTHAVALSDEPHS